MAVMDKSKLQAFAKKKASPPLAAQAFAQKKAMGAKPPVPGAPPAPGAAAAPHPGAPPAAPHPGAPPGHPAAPAMPGEESQVHLHELVEEAAQAAESGGDTELEDAVAGTKDAHPDQPPPWAKDPAKWKEAAEAVGIGVPGTEDKYDEPIVVAAYLYKMIGGPVEGAGALPEAPEAPADAAAGADMSKPGAAAKALHAKAMMGKPPAGPPAAGAAKPAPHPAAAPAAAKPAGAAPGAPGAKPPAPAPAKPPAPPTKAGTAPPPGHSPAGVPGQPPAAGGDAAGGDLKQLLDSAAQQATTSPDPDLVAKLQAEPPQEGMPPSWAADQDKWSMAEQAVKEHWAEYPDPWIVVAHVYKNMGGGVQ
jgi:hypothetical protein